MSQATTGPKSSVVPAGVPDEAAVLGRAGQENFTVASGLLLGRHRDALLALYGFARLVDELGDGATGDRLELLDWADAEVERATAGGASHPVFVRLGPVMAAHRLQPSLFHDLIEANRRDQSVPEYATFEDLAAYCALSANPVGRLVLGVFGAGTEENLVRSDAVCTGLQVVEHCQDVMEDAAAGRVYLPGVDLDAQGLSAADLLGGRLAQGVRDPDASVALAAVVRQETERAVTLLAQGPALVRALRGRARWAVAGFVGGGRAAADALAGAGYDVTAGAPKAGKRRRLIRSLQVLGGRS